MKTTIDFQHDIKPSMLFLTVEWATDRDDSL